MNNFKQIILELEKDSIYKPSKVANDLIEKYPELGNEIILPINMGDENDRNIPIFLFQQNENFQINGNFYRIVINLSNNFMDKAIEIVENIYNILTNIKIVGISCVFQEESDDNKIDMFKNKYFNLEEINNDEIQLSLIRYISINDENDVRCLEGYSTIDNTFLSHFEFNTKLINDKEYTFESFEKFYNGICNYKQSR